MRRLVVDYPELARGLVFKGRLMARRSTEQVGELIACEDSSPSDRSKLRHKQSVCGWVDNVASAGDNSNISRRAQLFVGREPQLAELGGCFASRLDHPHRTCGAGKTRLALRLTLMSWTAIPMRFGSSTCRPW